MQFTTIAAVILASVASAFADETCASGSQISCCTTSGGNSGVGGNVLGGSCLLDQVSLLSALDNICPSGNTFCCPSSSDGTLDVNASCVPINA